MFRLRAVLAASLIVLALSGREAHAEDAAADEPPASFRRVLPRGRIPSLDDPKFVPAAQARIPPEAWVLGVLLAGQARAYDLNLLTRHEVVNDRFGDTPVATVWCPLANAAVVYDRRIKGRELLFEPSGVLMNGSIVMQDKETDSFWPIIEGRSLYGPLKGTSLVELPVSVKMRFKDWVKEHPDTVVLSVGDREHLPVNPLAPYLASTYGFKGMVATDERLKTKDQVFAFELDGRHYAAPAASLAAGRVFQVGSQWAFLYRAPQAVLYDPTWAFASSAGFVLDGSVWTEKATGARFDPARGRFSESRSAASPRRLLGFDTFWYVWSLSHPMTELLDDGQSREPRSAGRN